MISSINSTSTTQAVTSEATESSVALGKDDFLNLLVTQLKYQDPLNPTDSTEFTAQLAQFSSLEQLYNIGGNLEQLEVIHEGMDNLQAISYIGKEVYSYQNNLNFTEGKDAGVFFNLEADAAAVSINISDSNGNIIRTISPGATCAGQNAISWDGLDNTGATAKSGIYTFEVSAYNQKDEAIDAVCYTRDTITGIAYDDGKLRLISGELTIPLSSIFKISEDQT